MPHKSVSLVTELISDRDRSKHALISKISSCSFFVYSYPKSLIIFTSSGKSSDDEKKVETISLGDCPKKISPKKISPKKISPKKSSAVHAGMRLCGLLMSLLPVWQLLLGD